MKPVPLDNDWHFASDWTAPDADTGDEAAATGLSGVQAWFSASKGGDDIGGTTTDLAEYASTAGRYGGTLDVTAVAAALTSYVGKIVYEVHAKSGDARKSFKRRVVSHA